jgi:hypothetical protein
MNFASQATSRVSDRKAVKGQGLQEGCILRDLCSIATVRASTNWMLYPQITGSPYTKLDYLRKALHKKTSSQSSKRFPRRTYTLSSSTRCPCGQTHSKWMRVALQRALEARTQTQVNPRKNSIIIQDPLEERTYPKVKSHLKASRDGSKPGWVLQTSRKTEKLRNSTYLTRQELLWCRKNAE